MGLPRPDPGASSGQGHSGAPGGHLGRRGARPIQLQAGRTDPQVWLINHRGHAHHSAAATVAVIYLLCVGVNVRLPRNEEHRVFEPISTSLDLILRQQGRSGVA